ncbi:MAG: VanZ family protein [Gammaproteobacteria bacterium]
MLPRTFFVSLCCFAVYALFRPEPWAMPDQIPDFDKFAHFALFLALSCCSYFVFQWAHPLVYQLLPLSFLAGFSEWFQAVFLSDRHFGIGDLKADVLGILLGFVFCMMCRRKKLVF